MLQPASYHTAERIIRQALKDAGRLQTGDDPSAEVYTDALGRLSDLIFTYQTQGLKLWLNSIRQVTLVANVATYALGPAGTGDKPARVLEGWYARTDGNRRPLELYSWRDYQSLGTLTHVGDVTGFFPDKQQLNAVVKFWPVPSTTCAANGSVELLVQRQAVGPVQLTEAIGFPVEWYMALRWGLADELATGQPGLIMDRCERKAKMFREALEDWDVEDASTRFQPDSQMIAPSRFR